LLRRTKTSPFERRAPNATYDRESTKYAVKIYTYYTFDKKEKKYKTKNNPRRIFVE